MEGYNNDQGGSSSSSRHVHHPRDTQLPISPAGRSPSSSPSHRPRGRPPGSKNKPKPPVIVTRDAPHALQSHMLEVSAGADIIDCLNNYASRNGRGVCVLSGTGTVSNVTIRHPTSGTVVALRGAFEILSLAGTVLPPPAPPGAAALSIFLSGGQGQVVGGNIVGPLIVTETVVLATASFANAVFERLPLEENVGGGPGGSQRQQVHAAASQSSGVTVTGGGGASSLPLFNARGNVAAPPGTYAFSADLSGWGGSNVALRPPPF